MSTLVDEREYTVTIWDSTSQSDYSIFLMAENAADAHVKAYEKLLEHETIVTIYPHLKNSI